MTKSHVKINLLETIRKRITGSTELRKHHNIEKNILVDIANETVEFLKEEILKYRDDTIEDVKALFDFSN